MNEEKKQPFYKTWWFWLIIAIVVIGVVFGVSKLTQTKTKTTEIAQTKSKKSQKPKPVTKQSQAKKVDKEAIYNYLTKEKKQKIKKSDIEISDIKASSVYAIKNNNSPRKNGWEIQGKINNHTKGASINLLSAVINLPDRNKSQIDYLAIGWDTYINRVKQNNK